MPEHADAPGDAVVLEHAVAVVGALGRMGREVRTAACRWTTARWYSGSVTMARKAAALG